MHDHSKKTFCYKCGKSCDINDESYPVCRDHGTLWPLKRNSICGEAFIVNTDGKVLLMKRATEPMAGSWALPGGFTDYGEHPSETAVREALEETGWKVQLTGEVLGVYLDSFPHDKNSEHRIVVSYIATPIEQETGQLDGESKGHEWFDIKDLPHSLIFTQSNRFRDYQQQKET